MVTAIEKMAAEIDIPPNDIVAAAEYACHKINYMHRMRHLHGKYRPG